MCRSTQRTISVKRPALECQPKLKTMKPVKAVTFNPQVRVHFHIHVNDIPERVVSKTWYSAEELAVIRQEVSQAAKTRSPEDFECFRGLECLAPSGAERRRSHKFHAWDAVLDEQDRQWDLHNLEPEVLAAKYHQTTLESTKDAYLMAQRDEESALDVFSPFSESSRNSRRRARPAFLLPSRV
eukprot:Nitzschia sp. Nitz4//scaffold16_size188269//67060//67608//NITZ4_001789-RA/size188269-processed-gene-0.49-mRNA-1//1//CDS//3329538511//7916//frame0